MPWPCVPDCPEYRGVNWIHPLKQRRVYELIEHTKNNYPHVRALAVFGSSVSDRCRPFSDLDIVVWKPSGTKFIPPDNDDYDIILPQQTGKDSELWGDILKEGVVVYVSDTVD